MPNFLTQRNTYLLYYKNGDSTVSQNFRNLVCKLLTSVKNFLKLSQATNLLGILMKFWKRNLLLLK